jgi:archaeosine synthase
MTDGFEVHARDGAARRGELRLADPLATPALVAPVDDDTPGVPGRARVVADAGSAWPRERAVPGGDPARLTVLPHRAAPAGTDERVAEAFFVEPPDVDFPSAAVVSTHTAGDHGADAYVLSDAPGAVGHAAAFVERVVTVREAIPPDSALYLAGVATPANAATLVSGGVDLVDADRAWIRGLEGFYLSTDGERFLEDVEEYPCACPACAGVAPGGMDPESCAEHNVHALAAELARVRARIADGRLRDYLEGQARHEPWCTAAMRRLDDQWHYLESRTHVARDAELTAATDDALRRVPIQRFADRVTARTRARLGEGRPLVIVPCSARKPYGDSQSHGQYRDAIGYRGAKLSMTSPIGVVPMELEWTYPAQHYDSVVTGRWTETELEFVADVLAGYLDGPGDGYDRIVAHVPPEGYREIVGRALDRAGAAPAVEFTVEDHPTTDASLAALSEAVSGAPSYTKRERQHATVRAVADYQFGAAPGGGHASGAGDLLFDDIRVDGRLPGLRVFAGPDSAVETGAQLAAMVPTYGTLALSLAGARRLQSLGRAGELSAPTARIDGFVPQGSVLAPGVVGATDHVRPGDEVVFEGPAAFGVGRALMGGPEMARSTRGVSVQVRHVEERE